MDFRFKPTLDDSVDKEMITWLPYPVFYDSVHCLNDYHLGRVMFEAGVILDHLVGTGHEKVWKRHRASIMWRGYESALGFYWSLSVREYADRGRISMRAVPYDFRHDYTTNTLHYAADKFVPLDQIEYPEWLGNEDFHASHRSNLLRKDKDFYSLYRWGEPDDLPYLWPLQEGLDADVDSNSQQGKIPELSEINAKADL